MIPAAIDALTVADIERLVTSRAEEGPTLDFKRDLPGEDRDSRKEFVADVCALANTRGGDLVYGIDEDVEGVAQRVVPQAFNPDNVITQLTNILSDGLEPRLHGVQMRSIDVNEGGRVLVVRVPRSFSGIHRSARDAHFWVRESRSKRQLDVAGITNRIADVLGREDRVTDLFARRYVAVATDTYPLALEAGPKVVLHLIPTRDVVGGEEVDLTQVANAGQFGVMPDGRSAFATHVYEGILHHPPVRQESRAVRAASLIFRSGLVEAVATMALAQFEEQQPVLPLENIEHYCVRFLESSLRLAAQTVSGGWPITVRIAVVGHGGVTGRSSNQDVRWHFEAIPMVRVQPAVLLLPDVLLEQWPQSIPRTFRSVFDRLWQAWGYPRSFSYQEQGDQLFWQRRPA